MPHIVFENKVDLTDFSQKFSPIFQRDSTLIKIQTIFRNFKVTITGQPKPLSQYFTRSWNISCFFYQKIQNNN